jgi:hypothetical protein
MYPERAPYVPAQRALEVHHPSPVAPAVAVPAPLVPVQPDAMPATASIVLPDGRVVTGYAVHHAQPEPLWPPSRPSPARR